MQLFARQEQEDGPDPSAKWGQDLPAPAAAEVEDPDDEDHMPIPAATAPASGNDDDDTDCEILEIIEARPLKYAYPETSAPVNPAGQAPSSRPATTVNPGASRKRADTGTSGTSDAEASAPPAPAAKKPKLKKKAGEKPRMKKGPPVEKG